MTALLQVDQLSIFYGRVHAVRSVSFDVEEGELFALLGPNGAGKTSLISAVVGLISRSEDSVRFGGSDITQVSAHRLAHQGIRLVPESRALFAEMTVEENLRMGLGRSARPEYEARRDELFETFPVLRDRIRQVSGTLSGGEQQMLSIARALIAKPRLLILDELSMGLAPKLVGEIVEVLGRLRDDGLTVLLAEQNANAVLPVADTAAIMVRGRIDFLGEPAAARKRLVDGYLGVVTAPETTDE